MIPIKIDGEKYNIKSILELNTAEYIEVTNIPDLDIVKYIAWSTGQSWADAFFCKYDKLVEKAIGGFTDVTKIKVDKKYKKYEISTVGQRYQIETCKKNGSELLVFVVAVAMAKSNEIEKVYEVQKELMEKPYIEVIPAGVFFLKRLKNGSYYDKTFFQKIRVFLTTLLTGKPLELSD